MSHRQQKSSSAAKGDAQHLTTSYNLVNENRAPGQHSRIGLALAGAIVIIVMLTTVAYWPF
jgi:hypothetical protein